MLVKNDAALQVAQTTWSLVQERFYDEQRLTDWAAWQSRFHLIATMDDALSLCDEMLGSLQDRYTRLLKTEEFAAKQARRESTEPGATARMIHEKIGYLRCSRFNQLNIADQFADQLEAIGECQALIIDLRGNGGGLVQQTMNCCQFFLQEGVIASLEERIQGRIQRRTHVLVADTSLIIRHGATEDDDEVDGLNRRSCLPPMPIAVVIDGQTASSAELFAAALQENHRAIVLGRRSCGKAIGQDLLAVSEDPLLKLKISCMRYLTPNGNWLGDGRGLNQTDGIVPDVLLDHVKEEDVLETVVRLCGWGPVSGSTS